MRFTRAIVRRPAGSFACGLTLGGRAAGYRKGAGVHLKTGIAYLGGGLWLVIEALQDVVRSWTGAGMSELIAVCAADSYAANCVRVNDAVLVAAGYPRVATALRDRSFVRSSWKCRNFAKWTADLSCLSLRLRGSISAESGC